MLKALFHEKGNKTCGSLQSVCLGLITHMSCPHHDSANRIQLLCSQWYDFAPSPKYILAEPTWRETNVMKNIIQILWNQRGLRNEFLVTITRSIRSMDQAEQSILGKTFSSTPFDLIEIFRCTKLFTDITRQKKCKYILNHTSTDTAFILLPFDFFFVQDNETMDSMRETKREKKREQL